MYAHRVEPARIKQLCHNDSPESAGSSGAQSRALGLSEVRDDEGLGEAEACDERVALAAGRPLGERVRAPCAEGRVALRSLRLLLHVDKDDGDLLSRLLPSCRCCCCLRRSARR